jgi:hypothetical protein
MDRSCKERSLIWGARNYNHLTWSLRRRKERAHAMEDALAQGTITHRLKAALNDNVVNRFRAVEMVILVVIIVLMVTKPF